MSVEHISLLSCNGCGEYYAYDRDPGPLAKQRKQARKAGWQTSLPGGRDLCSGCLSGVPNV